MEQHVCPNCDAPLRPAATFCLACDTPVAGAERGLSVAEPTVVRMGRPLVGVGVLLVVLLVVCSISYGSYSFVHDRHVAARTDATTNTKDGVTMLVDAEGGTARDCRKAEAFLAGNAALLHRKCLDTVGGDPGARLENVSVGRPSLASRTGTVRLTATLVDHTGSRPFDHDFAVVKQGKQWRLSWDGSPAV